MATAQQIRLHEIGGGVVRRSFTDGPVRRKAFEQLSRDDILKWPAANRNALIDKHFVEVYPRKPGGEAPSGSKRIAIHRGGGAYDVIEGVVLNAKPLTKEEAVKLAKQK